MEILKTQELIGDVKVKSQQQESNFLSPGELTDILQSALEFIYYEILDAEENYFLEVKEVPIDQDSNTISLYNKNNPEEPGNIGDFLRMELVECYETDYWYSLKRVGIRKASRIESYKWGPYNYNSRSAKFRLSYVPPPPKLIKPTNENPDPQIVTNFPQGVKNFIIFEASAQASDVEQTESNWQSRAEMWKKRIIDTVRNRDTSSNLQRGSHREQRYSPYGMYFYGSRGFSFYTLLSDHIKLY